MAAVANYSITKNLVAKKINLFVGDKKMTPAEADQFEKEFGAMLASINTADFSLEIDSTHMNVLTPEMAARLEVTLGLYKKAGFKKIIIKLENNPVLKMQVNRVARKADLTNLEIIH